MRCPLPVSERMLSRAKLSVVAAGGGGARRPSQAGQHVVVDSPAGEAWRATRAGPDGLYCC